MTRKQELFVREYLVDLNEAAAARRAGYSPNHCNPLRSQQVRQAVDAALDQRRQACEASAQKVRSALCQIAFSPATGQGVGHQVRCLELLAKLLGMFDGGTGVEPVTVVEDV